MAELDPSEYEDFDFGFTSVDEDELNNLLTGDTTTPEYGLTTKPDKVSPVVRAVFISSFDARVTSNVAEESAAGLLAIL